MSGTPVPSSFDEDEEFYSESRLQTLTRRIKQEPLVPLGCILTVIALVGATRAMRKNDHATANKMFRRRIYAQGFTIVALVVGSSYWKGDREKRKEFDKVEGERRRVEKRERWLKELEVRDEEDKMLMEEARRRGVRRAEHAERMAGKGEEEDAGGMLPNPVSEATKDLSWGKGK